MRSYILFIGTGLYPVYNMTEQKFIHRFALIWNGIMPRESAIYASGLEPTIPFRKMLEIGKKYFEFQV